MQQALRQPRPSVGSRRRSAALSVALTIFLVTAALAALRTPMDVPDTNSPPVSNATASANDWTSVGQTIVADRDGLHRVSLVIAAEHTSGDAAITFNVKETPRGEPLRTVKRPLPTVPQGDPGWFRPDTITERWYDFDFEPIPASAGRRFYVSLEGKDVPRENTVSALIYHHNQYPHGEAFLNEESVDAHLVFRSYSRGTLADLIAVLMRNVGRGKPGLLGGPALYLALGLIYALLVAAFLAALTRGAHLDATPALDHADRKPAVRPASGF